MRKYLSGRGYGDGLWGGKCEIREGCAKGPGAGGRRDDDIDVCGGGEAAVTVMVMKEFEKMMEVVMAVMVEKNKMVVMWIMEAVVTPQRAYASFSLTSFSPPIPYKLCALVC